MGDGVMERLESFVGGGIQGEAATAAMEKEEAAIVKSMFYLEYNLRSP